MEHKLEGSIHESESGAAVGDVWIRLVRGKEPSPEVVRTGEDGIFSLADHGQGEGTIEVADRDGQVLAEWPVGEQGQQKIRIEVPQNVLAGAAVRPREAPPVLRAAVLETIAHGIEQLDSAVQATAVQALETLTCTLPPIATVPDLVNLARDVLEGRAGASSRFREHLSQFEAWNTNRNMARTPPPAQELEALFEQLGEPERRPNETSAGKDMDRIVEAEVLVTVVAAAAAVGGDDLTRLWRGVQAVHGQLQALAQLRPLVRDARAASFGEPGAAKAFQYALGRYGGLCVPSFKPFPFPGDGNPIPYPDPGDWHDPIGAPAVNEDCIDIAGVVINAGAAAAGTRFTVTRFNSPDACPGETLEIHGTGLSPAGLEPMVGFKVEGSRAKRFVRGSASDTLIEVRVPDDAVCGELELKLPTRESIFECDQLLEFHARPSDESEMSFEGGRTLIWGLVHRPDGCVHAGEEVELAWQVCNASALELTIEISEHPPSDGSPGGLETISLDPADDSYTVRTPNLSSNGSLRATLVAISRCGRYERTHRVGIQRRPIDRIVDVQTERPFVNWHGNVIRNVMGLPRPTTLDELVDTVRTAERLNLRLGVEGSRWSFSDCMIPLRFPAQVIDTSSLDRILSNVLGEAALDNILSVLTEDARKRIDDALATAAGLDPDTTPPLPIRDRLVHVEAGIELWDLNCQLESPPVPLAIPNLGGARGQSIAGAINTGTHGATVDLPPIPDLVRAIHLVANGGQQWWIERRSLPITDEAAMRDLMARGVLDPCLELRYDDRLFDACLVAMGQAGIVYSMVVETVPLHNLREDTRRLRWEAVKTEIQNEILEPTGPRPWYYEVSVNPSPSRPAWVTKREPTSDSATTVPPATSNALTDALWVTLFGTTAVALGPAGLIGLGTGALAFVMGGLGLYFLRRGLELARIVTNPFEWWRIPEIQQEIDLIEQLINIVDDIVDAINTAVRGDATAAEQELAEALPDLLSALWRIGFYVVSGKQILDTIQNLFTNIDQRPPGTDVGKSYMIFTEQPDCASTPGSPQEHSALERLIHSQEYAVPADQLVDFADAILDEADAVRDGEDDALILILNLRFVLKTDAMMGLQQFPLTGLVEVWTIDRMEGNDSFHARVNRLANDFQALPHWGHVHEVQDLSSRFPRHAEWERQLNMIARTAGRSNTFRHQFALDRGLLSDLS